MKNCNNLFDRSLSGLIDKYITLTSKATRKNTPGLLPGFLLSAVLLIVTACGNPNKSKEKGMVSLFDGKSLTGWEVRSGSATYRVEDNTIKGTTVEGSQNTFLCSVKEFGDFILEFEVNCDTALNSGVQFRSHVYGKDTTIFLYGNDQHFKPDRVYGYQFEIAPGGSAGWVYDEARLGKWISEEKETGAYKPNAWNRCRIIAQGDHIRTFVNDVPTADFRNSSDATGFIGLQVHRINKGTGPYSVSWRNIKIRELKPGETI
jgi:hypothetical protein